MKKLRVFEAFSGVGSQRMALNNIGVEHEVIGIAEIDKYAIQSYMAIHGETKNYGDISTIDVHELPDMDLFTYSFPCQDLSIAGQQQGLGQGTRSGLLYECERIIEHKRPKFLLLENVKNLVGKKFKHDFEVWLEYLASLGYKNYWKVINANQMNLPQNRERVFVVSILDSDFEFEFPQDKELTTTIKELLDVEVDANRWYNKEFVLVDKGHEAEFTTGSFEQGKRIYSEEGKYINCITAKDRGVNNLLVNVGGVLKARKLTDSEAWKFMGFSIEHYNLAKAAGVPKGELFKQAGNSIAVPVLEGIFTQMFKLWGEAE